MWLAIFNYRFYNSLFMWYLWQFNYNCTVIRIFSDYWYLELDGSYPQTAYLFSVLKYFHLWYPYVMLNSFTMILLLSSLGDPKSQILFHSMVPQRSWRQSSLLFFFLNLTVLLLKIYVHVQVIFLYLKIFSYLER